MENGISKPDIERIEDIAEALEIDVSQLLINPQNLFTFNNNPNSNGVYGTQNQNNNDRKLLDKMMEVMEKMTLYFTSKEPIKK